MFTRRCSARKDGLGRVLLDWPGGSATMTFEQSPPSSCGPVLGIREFGISVPNQCVVARFDAPALSTRIDWAVSR